VTALEAYGVDIRTGRVRGRADAPGDGVKALAERPPARDSRHMRLGEIPARYHRAFNDRDFDVWREVFDEHVELVVDGMTFRGVDAAVAYGVGSVTQSPVCTSGRTASSRSPAT
jgi:hypothetical protein